MFRINGRLDASPKILSASSMKMKGRKPSFRFFPERLQKILSHRAFRIHRPHILRISGPLMCMKNCSISSPVFCFSCRVQIVRRGFAQQCLFPHPRRTVKAESPSAFGAENFEKRSACSRGNSIASLIALERFGLSRPTLSQENLGNGFQVIVLGIRLAQ